MGEFLLFIFVTFILCSYVMTTSSDGVKPIPAAIMIIVFFAAVAASLLHLLTFVGIAMFCWALCSDEEGELSKEDGVMSRNVKIAVNKYAKKALNRKGIWK